MSEPTWKAIERKVAAFFGVDRNPLSGGNSKHTASDTLHEKLFVEVKYRTVHSAITLWRATQSKAQIEGKIPVVCLAEKNKPGFWVVCHSSHLGDVALGRCVVKDQKQKAQEGTNEQP